MDDKVEWCEGCEARWLEEADKARLAELAVVEQTAKKTDRKIVIDLTGDEEVEILMEEEADKARLEWQAVVKQTAKKTDRKVVIDLTGD